MSRITVSFLALLFAWLVGPGPARADWINLTGAETSPNIAEIYVEDDRVRVVLEVYVGDLAHFAELVPAAWLRERADEVPPLEVRMRRFAEQTFKIVADDRRTLPAELKLVEPRLRVDRQSPFAGMINPFTRQRVPEAPTDKRVLYAELVYPFGDARPDALSFVPPSDERGQAKASIGFIAYHKAVPVIDFRYLAGPARLRLNWDDPWYSRFENPNLKRHHRDALMSFLYVEPYEVRHEVLTRVVDVQNWVDLGLDGRRYIAPDDWPAIKQRVGDFLMSRNPVRIDGAAVPAVLDRVDFVTVGIKGIRLLETPEKLEVSTAIVGVIMAHVIDGLPQEVTVDWELFTDRVGQVPATAIDPAGPLMSYLTPDDPRHVWTNYLKNYVPPQVVGLEVAGSAGSYRVPMVSAALLLVLAPLAWVAWRGRRRRVVLAVASLLGVAALGLAAVLLPVGRVAVPKPVIAGVTMDDERATALLTGVLENVYRAFDFRDEAAVYDKLALSVEGNLLSDLYLQNRRAFAVRQAGGAQARVKEVAVLAAQAMSAAGDGPGDLVVHGRWTALGTVGHWGHVHQRQNYYDARVTLADVDGTWKIVDLEVLEEKRVEPGQPVGSGQ